MSQQRPLTPRQPEPLCTEHLDDALMKALEQQAWRRFCMWQHDDALELAARLIQMAPERPWAYYLQGEIAGRLGQWERALDMYMKAIALGRRDPETLLRASESAMKLRRIQEAARWMAAAAAHP